MEYPGPKRDAQFESKTQAEKSFSLLKVLSSEMDPAEIRLIR
jgi:hypothetical protein